MKILRYHTKIKYLIESQSLKKKKKKKKKKKRRKLNLRFKDSKI